MSTQLDKDAEEIIQIFIRHSLEKICIDKIACKEDLINFLDDRDRREE